MFSLCGDIWCTNYGSHVVGACSHAHGTTFASCRPGAWEQSLVLPPSSLCSLPPSSLHAHASSARPTRHRSTSQPPLSIDTLATCTPLRVRSSSDPMSRTHADTLEVALSTAASALDLSEEEERETLELVSSVASSPCTVASSPRSWAGFEAGAGGEYLPPLRLSPTDTAATPTPQAGGEPITGHGDGGAAVACTTSTSTPVFAPKPIRTTPVAASMHSSTQYLSLTQDHLSCAVRGRSAPESVCERDLIMVICGILWERNEIPVGLLGTLLHEATGNHYLPSTFKERFGGLKKFLTNHSDIFRLQNNHRFNPCVCLIAWPTVEYAQRLSTLPIVSCPVPRSHTPPQLSEMLHQYLQSRGICIEPETPVPDDVLAFGKHADDPSSWLCDDESVNSSFEMLSASNHHPARLNPNRRRRTRGRNRRRRNASNAAHPNPSACAVNVASRTQIQLGDFMAGQW